MISVMARVSETVSDSRFVTECRGEGGGGRGGGRGGGEPFAMTITATLLPSLISLLSLTPKYGPAFVFGHLKH